MKYRFIISVLTLIIISNLADAQLRSFGKVQRIKLWSSEVLLENNSVKGYCFFYSFDMQAATGKNYYLLRILDQDLKDVKTVNIEESKNVLLVETEYNGQAIILKLIDFKKNRSIYISFDRKGNYLNKEEKQISNREVLKYGTKVLPRNVDIIHSIKDFGFVDYGISDDGKGYNCEMHFTNDTTFKKWTYSSEQIKKEAQFAGFLGSFYNTLYNVVVKTKNRSGREFDFYIQGFDIPTGEKLFEVPLKDEKFIYQPLTAYYDSIKGQIDVLGIYHSPAVMKLRDNGEGLYRFSIDNKGNISDKKLISYKTAIATRSDLSDKQRIINAKSYIAVHDVVKSQDGSIVIIGEQFQRVEDGVGIALNLMSIAASGSSHAFPYTKTIVRDLVFLHISPDFDPEFIEFIEKTKSELDLLPTYDFVNNHYLAHIINAYGGFDYMFTQNVDDEITVGYLDQEKKEHGVKEWVFGISSYKNDQYISKKKILRNLRSQEKVHIMQAKPGYFLLAEYVREEKKLNIRLEKID